MEPARGAAAPRASVIPTQAAPFPAVLESPLRGGRHRGFEEASKNFPKHKMPSDRDDLNDLNGYLQPNLKINLPRH